MKNKIYLSKIMNYDKILIKICFGQRLRFKKVQKIINLCPNIRNYLLNRFDYIESIKESLHRNLHNKKYMDKVSLLISDFGIDKYKDFVDNYNKDLELQKENGSLLTPEEIINGTFEINLRV